MGKSSKIKNFKGNKKHNFVSMYLKQLVRLHSLTKFLSEFLEHLKII